MDDDRKDATCPHCGQQMLEHRHSVNRGIVSALATVYAHHGRRPFHLSRQGLDMSQVCNFQKLQYWGLVGQHVTGGTCHRRGWWAVTAEGQEFLMGARRIHRWARTFNRKVVGYDGALVGIHEVIEGYQYRGDYAEQARAASKPHLDGQVLFEIGNSEATL